MRFVVALVVPLALAACASNASAPAGGVIGTVTIGPTCPVEIQGSPCPPSPWTGTVRATGSDGSTHDVATDGTGHYELALDPGIYTIAPLTEGGGPPTAKPVTVTVGDSMQHVDLQLDSGFR
jgi:hypothetical protein